MNNTKSKPNFISAAALILLCVLMCQGCKGKAVPESHALTVDSSGVTGAGIMVGSSYDEWIAAYSDYEIQLYDGENFTPFTPVAEDESAEDASLVDHNGRYMVAAFYVDEQPVSTDELCKAENVEADALADYLASPEYLEKHSVVFRYIIFTITDDAVSDIEFDYLDYNNEL